MFQHLQVSLEDVYNGTMKKLALQKSIICPTCKGNCSHLFTIHNFFWVIIFNSKSFLQKSGLCVHYCVFCIYYSVFCTITVCFTPITVCSVPTTVCSVPITVALYPLLCVLYPLLCALYPLLCALYLLLLLCRCGCHKGRCCREMHSM